MVHEIEVKYRVADVEALVVALKSRGVELGDVVVQDDQAYAPAGWSYGDAKAGVSFVRLRTVNGRHTFTLKRPRENALSVDEFESVVADRDQMHSAILAMGYAATTRIVKTRRTGRLGDIEVCMDEVDGLGAFVELERMVADEVAGAQVQADLDAVVRSWGLDVIRSTETYDSLIHTRRG